MEMIHEATSKEKHPAAVSGERDDINLDYRILALLIACATRADLLDEYLQDAKKADADSTKWAQLRRLGFPQRLLAETLYLAQDPATVKALQQLQLVTGTLVNLNDYCFLSCPDDNVVAQLVHYTAIQTQPLQRAGVEG